MARIVILDDNRSTGALLKGALEREDHQVCLVAEWQGLSAIIEEPNVDLVLIHQDDFQWTAFNQFKTTHKDSPAMLYVIRDYNLTNTVWIVRAVREALARMNKLADSPTLWCWDTACSDSGMSFFVP